MIGIGADRIIDYTREDITRSGRRYDKIVDFAAHHSIIDYLRALSPREIYVMVGGSTVLALQVMFLGPLISKIRSHKIGLLLHKPNQDMTIMKEFIEADKVRPIIDKCYPLSEVPEALRYFGDGHARGKVVISVVQNRS